MYCTVKTTECVTDLDQQNEMIILESILTTFKSSIIFRCSRGSSVNWLELKIKPPSANLACSNLQNAVQKAIKCGLSINELKRRLKLPEKPSCGQSKVWILFSDSVSFRGQAVLLHCALNKQTKHCKNVIKFLTMIVNHFDARYLNVLSRV